METLYVLLSRAEDGFSWLKGDLGLRPNYHQLEVRVDAHIFLTVLAHQLLRFITYTLEQKGDPRDWPTLRMGIADTLLHQAQYPDAQRECRACAPDPARRKAATSKSMRNSESTAKSCRSRKSRPP